jgi:hypothetical protein
MYSQIKWESTVTLTVVLVGRGRSLQTTSSLDNRQSTSLSPNRMYLTKLPQQSYCVQALCTGKHRTECELGLSPTSSIEFTPQY